MANEKRYKDTPNRLQTWDYTTPGLYYLTICTHNRMQLFGIVENGEMILSEFGVIVRNEILKIPEYHKRIVLDEWVVMPDHVHLLIELGDWDFDNGISLIGDSSTGHAAHAAHVGQIHEFALHVPYVTKQSTDDIKQYRKQRRRMLIPKIAGKFQMLTSKHINLKRNTPGQINWQHDYYDHIVRNHISYQIIKQYIKDNPKDYHTPF